MSRFNQISESGEGTRPTTSGGVDNIGAGEKLSTERTAAGEEVSGPAPTERMANKRKDVEGSKHDDSAAYNLREDLSSTPNKERTPPPDELPSNQPSTNPIPKGS
ncbi:conserved hypothetical protein [Burkholderiales bacterium 8X]|nr:conserved hypothetical protein [Burkholderiales bacterium 8X]